MTTTIHCCRCDQVCHHGPPASLCHEHMMPQFLPTLDVVTAPYCAGPDSPTGHDFMPVPDYLSGGVLYCRRCGGRRP